MIRYWKHMYINNVYKKFLEYKNIKTSMLLYVYINVGVNCMYNK